MLKIFLYLFFVSNVIFASPISQLLDDTSTSESLESSLPADFTDTTEDSTLSSNPNNLNNAGCPPAITTDNQLDENIDNSPDLNILRREAKSCPVTGFVHPWGKTPSELLKTPTSPSAQLADPSHQTNTGDSDYPCTKSNRLELVTCGGREVMLGLEIRSVTNCVRGESPSRHESTNY